jgi:SAM-dependent methyltransferase
MTSGNDEIARYWNENADDWARELRQGRDVYREHFLNPAFLEFLGPLRDVRVLDAACGEGAGSRLMAQAGADVTGLDISERMIGHAQAEEARQPLGIRYSVGSIDDLAAVPDACLDAVVSWVALMDAPGYAPALRAFHRVLKPGGRLQFAVLHPCFAAPAPTFIQIQGENRRRLAMAGYFRNQPRIGRWAFAGNESAPDAAVYTVPRHPRTISEYVNGLIAAGFTLKEIGEPRPGEEACASVPRLAFWRDEACLYLFVRADKPA